MIQLKVYDSPAKETQYWLDLYDTEPIKLTLSIEDITNADATSTFSRAFKVPGTRKNAEFFKNSFDVDGTMFDVTIKKPAEILVDGAEFKQGHVRLQKIFINTEQDRYDYELLFLGETRDFSSRIGDKGLCELQMPDLVGGASGSMLPTDAVTSWQAYPEGPTLTSGLHDGNIIYPLIDHGNTYDATNTVEQTRIALDHSIRFTQQSHPLTYDRLKPMIRAKRIWDQIFEDAGYTYTSDFLESELFHQIYISAFGNSPSVGWSAELDNSPDSDNVAHVEAPQGDVGPLAMGVNEIDPGNNISTSTKNISGWGNYFVTYYQVPTAGTYTFAASCFYSGFFENSNGSLSPISAYLDLYNITTQSSVASSNITSNGTLQFNVELNTTTGNISVGDQLCLIVQPSNAYPDQYDVINVEFDVLAAPGDFNPAASLECTYKQIDFVKDILTAFRLVLAPDPNNAQNFIIEPWQTYINSGQLYDWSKKLVESKEVVVEPVFFSQSDVIDFKFQQGGDYTNIYHTQATSEPYGWLQFDSGNDLLKGQREVKLIGIASTPIAKIEGAAATTKFTIPQLHTHSSEDSITQHLPIKPKTRMLFYNGLQDITNNVNHWYLQGTTGNTPDGNWNVYPLVSPYQAWPIQPGTLNLNWANDIQYWGTLSGYNQKGSTLYTDYWSRYIESLYNRFSRRVTAYFVLNNIDLNTFSFDDTIFVNGTYYRPEKIIDVEVGDYTEVQVQLLTANDFRPSVVPDQPLEVISVTGVSGGCFSYNGQIDVVTNGTPGFTWVLSNGQSGIALANAPVGQAPYSFSILNVPPGTYTIDITDNLGRPYSTNVTVPAGTETLPEASQLVFNANDCVAPCDGSIIVTATGNGPFEIYWYDTGTTQSFTTQVSRTGLCPGDYSYYITDVNGCMSPSYLATVECITQGGTVWNYAKYLECAQLSTQFYKVFVPTGTTPQPTDVVTLTGIEVADPTGCFAPVNETTGTADYDINQYYADCESCQALPISWQLQKCGDPLSVRYVDFSYPLSVGQVVKDATPGYQDDCYEVLGLNSQEVGNTWIQAGTYDSCAECQGGTPGTNLLIEDCTTAQAYVLPNTYGMSVGQTVQYVRDSEPGTVYCGTIYSTTSSLPTDGTLYSSQLVRCGSVNCNFSPAPTEYYVIQECGTENFWTGEVGEFNFNIGDTIQYTFNNGDPATYCGTIIQISLSGNTDFTPIKLVDSCADQLNCFQ